MCLKHQLNCFPTCGIWATIRTAPQSKKGDTPPLRWSHSSQRPGDVAHCSALRRKRSCFLSFSLRSTDGKKGSEDRGATKTSPVILISGVMRVPSRARDTRNGEGMRGGGGGGGGAQGTFLQHPVWVCFRKRPPVAKHHKSRTIAHREESREGFRSKWHWGQSLSTSIQLVMPAKLSQCYESPEKTVAPTLFYQSSANKKRSHELLTHNNDKEDDNISYACYESEDPHSRSYSVVS